VDVSTGVGETCTITLSNGAGSCTLALRVEGERTIIAGYDGNATFAASFDTEAHTVQGPASAPLEIAWSNPADITYGTALGSAQLNATASAGGQPVAGSFTYEPAAGTILDAGEDQQLKATFTPDDPEAYESATVTVLLDVLRAPTTLTLDASSLTTAYDGQAKVARFTATPSTVAADVTLEYKAGGQAVWAPTDAGVYQVTATLPASPNYEPASATGNLTIKPAATSLAWSVPASTVVGPLSASLLTASATGVGGAAVQGTYTYAPAAGQFLDAAPSRSLSVSFQPSSSNYTAATKSVSLAVRYPWSGFFEPTNNPQVLNRVKAGTAIPIRFSLGGNQPAPVLSSGSPSVSSVSCPSWTTDAIEQTVSASSSSLRYESSTGQYVYTWKTQSSWAGKCRRFSLVLKDGTRREAFFRFVK
jgi:large repetitive protein